MVLRKPCLECGVPSRSSRCPRCAEKILISKPRPERAGASQRGYDASWQRIRKLVLDRDGWCCYQCQKMLSGADATVDHIIPMSQDPSLRLDTRNLAACCRSCNSIKGKKISNN